MKLPGIKRLLPLILTVLLILPILAMPAMAASNNEIELLNYVFVDNGTRNYYTMQSSGELHYVPMISPSLTYRIDMLVWSQRPITSVQISRNGTNAFVEASVTSLGNSLYVITLDPASTFQGVFYKIFYEGTSTNVCQVHSCKVVQIPVSSFAAPFTAYIFDRSNYSYSYSGGNVLSDLLSFGTGAAGTEDFSINCEIPLNNFDSIDIGFYGKFRVLNSLSAYVDGQTIPVSFSMSQNAYVTPHVEYVTVHLDLSDLDFTKISTGIIHFRLTGQYQDGDGVSDYIQFIYSTGYIETAESNPLLFFFNNLFEHIDSGFESLVEALGGSNDSSGVQDEISSAVGQLEQAGAALDAVQRPDLGQIDINVVGMVDPAGLTGVAAIASLFTGNELIYTIMVMFVTLALISYILFGK